MTLQTFRHLPNEIQAIQFTGENQMDIISVFGEEGIEVYADQIDVTTTHGDIAHIRVNDWIVPDSTPHTFYPVKAEVFDDSYVPVVTGKPSEKLTIDWPFIVPEGTPLTRSDVKAGWSAVMTPLQEAGRGNEPDIKALAGVFRSVYGAMPETS